MAAWTRCFPGSSFSSEQDSLSPAAAQQFQQPLVFRPWVTLGPKDTSLRAGRTFSHGVKVERRVSEAALQESSHVLDFIQSQNHRMS